MNERWRLLATLLLLFGTVGTLAELLLLEHFEDAPQWVPLTLLGAGAVVATWSAVRPSAAAVRTMHTVMALFIIAGVLGVYYHLKANVEFELELRPSMAGWELVKETLRGAMPALAPGTMVQLGLLGFLTTLRHPAIHRREDAASRDEGIER